MQQIDNNVTAISSIENEVVRKFHFSRILFIVIANKVYAETTPSGMSHFDWIKTLDISDSIVPYNSIIPSRDYQYIIDNFTRGYFYNNTIVFYRGVHFDADSTVVDDIRYCTPIIKKALKLNNDTIVGLGCAPKRGTIFDIKHRLGTISDIEKITDFSKIYKLVNG